MEEIITKLRELVGICETRLKKLDLERSEVAGHRATLEAEKSDNFKRKQDLDDREKKIKSLELAGKTLAEAEEILKEASIKEKKLNEMIALAQQAKIAHEKDVANFNADMDRQKQKLVQQSKDLEIKERNYKREIMEAVHREVENAKK